LAETHPHPHSSAHKACTITRAHMRVAWRGQGLDERVQVARGALVAEADKGHPSRRAVACVVRVICVIVVFIAVGREREDASCNIQNRSPFATNLPVGRADREGGGGGAVVWEAEAAGPSDVAGAVVPPSRSPESGSSGVVGGNAKTHRRKASLETFSRAYAPHPADRLSWSHSNRFVMRAPSPV